MAPHRRRPAIRVGLSCFLVATVLACASAQDGAACVDVKLDCMPIVSPPTFSAIYANIFSPSCALGTGSCHGPAVSAGLDMRTEDSAYQGLSTRSRPDSVGCSLVLRRVESTDESFRMPPGPTPLSEPQRCAIRQWIANGAHR
jgi:hypothetical protein